MTYLPRQFERLRAVDRMLWFAAACLMLGFSAHAEEVQQVSPRFLITPSQIVDEMQRRQLPTSGVQVKIAAPITSAMANPPLEILAVSLLSPHEIRLRLTCRNHSQCLPFFATATLPETLSAASISTKREPSPDKLLTASTTETVATAKQAETPINQGGATHQPVVRSGASAFLELDQDRVHIRLEVICLQSGAEGDRIRVATRDRKEFYVAKVITPTLLKGSL